MSVKWCGAASAVTRKPSALAARTSATLPAVDRCSRWMRAPVRRAQLDVAMDHQLLGDRRPAGQAEVAAARALVHHRTLGQRGDLAVLRQRDVEGARVLERVPHQLRILHAVAVVGEQVDSGSSELAERRQRLALAVDGDASGGMDVAQPGAVALGRARTRSRTASPAPARCWASPRSR